MCFGLPMRIVESNGLVALCDGAGRQETVSLALTGELAEGEYVLVHLGTALRSMSEEEAADISNAISAVAAAVEGRDYEHLIQDLVDREPALPPGLHPDDDLPGQAG
ncbi:MAG: HypC/HybG/HupF family hydrogenase formation chaperone [Hyphomonas sp.]|uniref:HypC/HybG/HupF family hydrogenase formation chaperone n=1 Tax=Hyphomonas sp. TaxID=87 RepID=UPI003529D3A6